MTDPHDKPNILITGTPGTGKTTFAAQLAEKLTMEHLNVGKIAEENDCFEGEDGDRECKILDDEKLLDSIEDRLNSKEGGFIVDYHGSDFFPVRWFDIVFVLRTDNTKLYDRLAGRDYSESKIKENIECEIFGTLLEEAQESYPEEIVHQLQSNTPEDMESNLESVAQWAHNWENNKKQ